MSLIDQLEQRGKQNSQVPGWIRLLLVVPPIALGLYWSYTYTGLYRWLAELQIDLFGGYYIWLSAILSIVIVLIPSMILISIISRNFQNTPSDGKLGWTDKLNILSKTRPGFLKWYIVGFFLGIGTLPIGLYFLLMYGTVSSTPVPMDLQSAKPAEQKTIEYISTSAVPYCDGVSGLEESEKKVAYFPLYDAKGEFTYVFLETVSYSETKKFKCQDSLTTFTGLITPESLPGIVRDSYIKAGYLEEGTAYAVLENETSPYSKKELTYIMFGLSAIGFALFGFLHWKNKPFNDEHYETAEATKQ